MLLINLNFCGSIKFPSKSVDCVVRQQQEAVVSFGVTDDASSATSSSVLSLSLHLHLPHLNITLITLHCHSRFSYFSFSFYFPYNFIKYHVFSLSLFSVYSNKFSRTWKQYYVCIRMILDELQELGISVLTMEWKNSLTNWSATLVLMDIACIICLHKFNFIIIFELILLWFV